MPNCSRCKCSLLGNAIICNPCWQSWPRGKDLAEDLAEYLAIPYNPKPVIIPMGFGTANDYPV